MLAQTVLGKHVNGVRVELAGYVPWHVEAPTTTNLLPSAILIESSTGSLVHVLMLSIQAMRGLPRLRALGIVPCIISFDTIRYDTRCYFNARSKPT